MKRFVAIALIGMFSFLMVGTAYASLDEKVAIELKKDFDNLGHDLHFIADGLTPSVTPEYGKMVTVLAEDDLMLGYVPDIDPSANGPPLISIRCF